MVFASFFFCVLTPCLFCSSVGIISAFICVYCSAQRYDKVATSEDDNDHDDANESKSGDVQLGAYKSSSKSSEGRKLASPQNDDDENDSDDEGKGGGSAAPQVPTFSPVARAFGAALPAFYLAIVRGLQLGTDVHVMGGYPLEVAFSLYYLSFDDRQLLPPCANTSQNLASFSIVIFNVSIFSSLHASSLSCISCIIYHISYILPGEHRLRGRPNRTHVWRPRRRTSGMSFVYLLLRSGAEKVQTL